jgi:hypothetical protein
MKTYMLAALAALSLAAAYVASPFVTAWSIREAIRTGDSAYLEAKLEWPTVRSSLRESLTEIAIGPAPAAAEGMQAPRPGLWQRIKNSLSRSAVDNLVASYVTPEGLPQLFTMRKFYRENISAAAEAEPQPWYERAQSFWSRIKRAEFQSPRVFEIELADRDDPTRRYVGLLELRGFVWKLTELRLHMIREAELASGADPA